MIIKKYSSVVKGKVSQFIRTALDWEGPDCSAVKLSVKKVIKPHCPELEAA